MSEKIDTKIVLNILSLEDSVQDFEIIRGQLIHAGYALNISRVDKESEFISLLRTNSYDIILADFKLPGFDAFEALQFRNEIYPDVPFICVSGAIGEETAVKLLKSGANDYVIKDRLERLPFAIKNAIIEAKEKENRRIAEDQLRLSEERFRAIWNESFDGMRLMDKNGTIVMVNNAFCNQFGKSRDELEDQLLDVLYTSNEGKRILATTIEGFRTKTFSPHFEMQLTLWNDRTVWFEISNSIIELGTGQQFLLSIFRDITDRKRSEENARKNVEKHRGILQTALDGFWLTDKEGFLLEVNDNYCTMSGYSKEELLTMRISDLEDAETAEATIAHIQSIIIKGEDRFESRHRRKNGTIFDVEVGVQFQNIDEGRFVAFLQDITERKQAAKKLKEIVTKNPMSVQILDKDGFTLEVNNSFKLLFGSVPPPGYSIFNDIQFAQQGLSEIFEKLRSGQVVRFPDVCFNPHDSISGLQDVSVWTRTIGFSLNDNNDKPEQFVLMHENITERKHTEEALRESEEIFSQFMEHSPVYVFFKNENIRATRLSRNYETMLGRPIDELLGKNMDDLFPSDLAKSMVEDDKKILHGGMRVDVEEELNGRYYLTTKFPIDVEGKPRYLAGFTIDITERRKAENALRESEERYRTVVSNTPVITFVTDEKGIFTLSEGKGLVKLGLQPGQVVGLSVFDVYREYPAIIDSMKKALAGNSQRIEIEVQSVIFDVFFSSVVDQQGNVVKVIGVSTDITEHKNSEQALRNAQKLESIGTLAGGIAHDFNNLMNAVLGQSALALNKLPKESPAVNHITKAIKASERVADLTRQLLAYSGRGKFFIDEIDLNNLVKENIQILEVSIPKTTQLRYELSFPSPHIKGDISQIQQVIMNLIINAGEAMVPNPGQITLRTNRIELTENNTEYSKYSITPLAAGSYALLQVSDTGCGISQDTLTRIFDPFFTTKFMGRGLGLAAVLGIIKGHKGGLRIVSEVGKGTMFEIVIPLVVPSATTDVAEKNESPVVKGEERTILVIDDESSMIELLEDLLSAVHFKVIGASDPLKGIERYRQEQQNISMVILDYSMPVMDGKAAFEELLKINKDVKVLLCSGYNEEETMSAFGLDRPTGFFQKPYKIEALVKRVSEILSD